MAMTRVKYGIEFDAPAETRRPSGHGWIVVLILVAVAIAFIIRVIRHISDTVPAAGGSADSTALVVSALSANESTPAEPSEEAIEASRPVVVNDFNGRSPKVKNLLLRLDDASREGDLEKQVQAIEQLRQLPGDAVADIDDTLVEKLGKLNMSLLFDQHNPQWVTEVVTKRGDSASRLALESGSTLGSMKLLNPAANFDRLQIGSTILVMNHPSFTLIVHKKLRTVDLNLHGKLFKRYHLPASAPDITMEPGGYRVPANIREYFRRQGIGLNDADAREIDLLVPRNTPLRVSAS